MGGFCVYGVSRLDCRRKAEKVTSVDQGMTIPEWDAIVKKVAERMWNEEKVVKISQEFDAPQFCDDWIAMAGDQVKLVKVMCRVQKVDKHGAISIKGGQPVMTWAPFERQAKSEADPRQLTIE